jgi:tetratricopeptide (TPR) repeat protein
MLHRENKKLLPTTMECDDFGVAFVVHSELVRLSDSSRAQSRMRLLNSKVNSRTDYQSDAEVVALHSRRRAESLVQGTYQSCLFRFGPPSVVLFLLPIVLVLFCGFQNAAQTAREHFERAQAAQRAGENETAEREYLAFLKLAPKSAEAYSNLGVIYARQSRFADAIQAYARALEFNPALTPILLNLGIAYYRAENFQAAITPLEKFLAAAPGNPQAGLLLGLSYARAERYTEALPYLESSAGASADVTARFALARVYLKLNRRAESLALLEALVAGNPESAEVHLLSGHAHLAEASYQKAIESFQLALKYNPQLQTAHYGLATAYHKLGENDRAVEECRKEAAMNPGDAETNWLLGLLLESRGELDEASRRALTAVESRPDFGAAWYLRGKISFRQNRFVEAEKWLVRATGLEPEEESYRFLLGQTYQRLGKKTQAVAEFEKVKEIKERNRAREAEKLKSKR